MNEGTFAEFTPITLSTKEEKDNIVKYYADNGISNFNTYMQNYLSVPESTSVPTSKEYSEDSTKPGIANILGSIDFSTGKLNLPVPKDAYTKSPYREGVNSGNPKEFIDKYKVLAEKASKEIGVSADLMLAQIALESG